MIDPMQPHATPYDVVDYPTAIFAHTHPDRLGAIAHLHDIHAAAPGTAKVLEVACGDAMNLLAMAVAAPEARFTGFDIASTVIERGRSRAAAAGLGNVQLEVRDLVEAARGLEGTFDYIIAHGLYAWVSEAEREALFALIGRVLAPAGIAFVSYNTLPGGYFRMAIRDLMRHFIPTDADPTTALRTARAVLRQFAEPQSDDGPDMAGYRYQAERVQDQADGLLFHDELGAQYHPQHHSAVCAAAQGVGLIYLADGGRRRFDDGFLPEGIAPGADVNAQIVSLAQQRDLIELRYFRHSLFVRAEIQPRRILEPSAARGLWASARYARNGEGWCGEGGFAFAVKDAALQAALERLADAMPARVPVADLSLDDGRLSSLLRMFDLRYIQLHTSPTPFATSAPERPAVSTLARSMIDEGLDMVCTMDHVGVRIEDPAFRLFLSGLDGSRDVQDMPALAIESGFAEPTQWKPALDTAVQKALIMLPEQHEGCLNNPC
jgi:ubiquinone/menaquinone biosynthesis C-methylase UbiE